MHKGWVLPSETSGWAQTWPWLGSSDSSHICRGGATHLQAFLTTHGTQYDQPGASLQPLSLSPGGEPGTWGLCPMGETACRTLGAPLPWSPW